MVAARELLGDRRSFGRACDLEVVATTAEIDDAFVVRVLENANEHPIAEALGIAAEQIARATTHVARANGFVARREIVHGAPYEIERFGAREALARLPDRTLGLRRLALRDRFDGALSWHFGFDHWRSD